MVERVCQLCTIRLCPHLAVFAPDSTLEVGARLRMRMVSSSGIIEVDLTSEHNKTTTAKADVQSVTIGGRAAVHANPRQTSET